MIVSRRVGTGLFWVLGMLVTSLWAREYRLPELGYRIVIDDRYALSSETGGVYLFTTPNQRSMILVRNWPGLTAEAVGEASRQGYREEGLALSVKGKAVVHSPDGGWGMTFPVAGMFEGHRIEGRLGGFVGTQGQGMVVLVAAVPAQWPDDRRLAASVIDSIGFIEYAGDEDFNRWRQYLSGRRLAYRSTYEGGSSREDYYLCSDGRFLQSAGDADFSSAPGVSVFGQSHDRAAGDWRLVRDGRDVYLVFRYGNGEEEHARLEDRQGKTLLNGVRYYVVENDQCP